MKSLLYQLAGIDQFNNDDVHTLSNIRPISDAEKKAQQIIKKYPHLKQSDVLKETEEGWLRVVR